MSIKKHFEVLDGLRGSAAILVVMFHLLEANFPDLAVNPLHHAFIAVDFFFLLSGFVVGYAYDDRWNTMSVKEFFRIRLTRLHPLVLLGVSIGVLGYLFDPFAGNAQEVSFSQLLIPFSLGILLIPSPALPNRYDETHSLNAPCWTLLQEYLANIAYALIAPKISRRGLVAIVIVSGLLLITSEVLHGPLWGGWGWSQFWVAPVRTAFPFFAGLLLYRSGFRIKIPFAFFLLSALLLIIFSLPYFKYAGLYEAACIIFVFPLIVAAGAGSENSGWLSKFCNLSGKLSYPLYITHFPFIYIYTHWINESKPSLMLSGLVGAGLFMFFILLAWLSLKYYDEPVRNWLNKRNRRKKETYAAVATVSQ